MKIKLFQEFWKSENVIVLLKKPSFVLHKFRASEGIGGEDGSEVSEEPTTS